MLSYLQGTLKECHPQYVVVDAMGLGFHVLIPASFYFQMPHPGQSVIVYTYLQIKDDGLTLYGFRSYKERDFFKMLLGVSGIGPKVALSLLGHLSMLQISDAIMQEDILSLTSIPGIGSKTAKRVVYELKDKVSAQYENEADFGFKEQGGSNNYWQDVQQALIALGYSPQETNKARKVLSRDGDLSVEDLFKEALDFLAKQ
ncbi:MAG: Holliday junction branch migration protein RuvA [Bacillota bacterium]|nr:Holliday junction branch migration protein RuvA [Bacillota bacterium]